MSGFLFLIGLAASLDGRLTNAVTGAPVRKADVVVGTPAGVALKRVLTDRNGRYSVDGLPKGTYRVAAGRAGYAAALAPGVVVLGEGEARHDVNFTMNVPAVVSGRVLDGDGEPVEGVSVSALRREGGWFQIFGSAKSNDEGEYRIANLSPGVYMLRTERHMRGAAEPEQVARSTIYSGAQGEDRAVPVQIAWGGEAQGIDLHVAIGPGVRIRGVLSGFGAEMPRVTVWRKSGDGLLPGGPEAEVMALPDGMFAAGPFAPGTYFVTAAARIAGGKLVWASKDVVVAAGEPECRLALEPAGALELEANEPVRAGLVRHDGFRSEAGAPGRFPEITPGIWELDVTALAGVRYVEAALLGDKNVLGVPFALPRGPWPKLRITVSDAGAKLEGVGSLVRLEPMDHGAALEAQAAPTGAYRIEGIRPGRYRLSCSGEVLELKARESVRRDCKL